MFIDSILVTSWFHVDLDSIYRIVRNLCATKCSNVQNFIAFLCGKNRTCTNFFRCRGSQICIHLENVCDYFKDFIHGDEELLCETQNVTCPSKCECLALAISCSHTAIVPSDLSKYFPYLAVNVLYSQIHNFYNFITSLKNVQIVNFQGNNIINICSLYDMLHTTIVIDYKDSWEELCS